MSPDVADAIDALASGRRLSWSEWLSARATLARAYETARDSRLFGYDSALAATLGNALDAEPSHELVSAHCGDHPDVASWGRRVARSLDDTKREKLQRLTPGARGGVL